MLVLAVIIALGSFLVYNRMDRTYYIEYTESGASSYKVQYKENDYFEGEWIEKDKSYISSLINKVVADFEYTIDVESDNMDIKYTYWIDAKLTVTNKNSGYHYYTLEERILPMKSALRKDVSEASFTENVSIDYTRYDAKARSFISTYDLKDATSLLTVTLVVETECSNDSFSNVCGTAYSTSLNIPLAENTFSIYSTQSSPANEIGSFEYQGQLTLTIFLVALIIVTVVCAAIAILLFAGLFVFLALTKNEDITYAARIRKIMGAYGSFIQRIDGDFDAEGYQIVMIKTFNEMLGIRDTIQSPILMFENRDETMTRFFIPTNTRILYVFEIKVDNYDEIYSRVEEPTPEETVEEPTPEEQAIEEPLILEEVDGEELAEAIAQPDVVLSEIEYVPDDDDQYEVAPEEPGIEVVGVVWPEKAHKNKVYRYDPNGEILSVGDIVVVPTMDRSKGREVIRKVAVAHGNHRVDPEHIKFPLKKIIAVLKHSVAHSLTPKTNEQEKLETDETSNN